MRESKFNTELTNSLKYWGAFAYKIADLPVSMTMGMRFTPDKPCDIIAGYAGKFFGVESKQIKKYEAFGMRHIRDSQIKHMDQMLASGCRAFVFLNVRIPPIKGKQKRENRTIIFDWAEFKKLEKSIGAKEIAALPFIGYQSVRTSEHADDKATEIIYDVKPFLESL